MTPNNVSSDMLMKIIEICSENGIGFKIENCKSPFMCSDILFDFKRGDTSYHFAIDGNIPFFDVELDGKLEKMITKLKGELQ